MTYSAILNESYSKQVHPSPSPLLPVPLDAGVLCFGAATCPHGPAQHFAIADDAPLYPLSFNRNAPHWRERAEPPVPSRLAISAFTCHPPSPPHLPPAAKGTGGRCALIMSQRRAPSNGQREFRKSLTKRMNGRCKPGPPSRMAAGLGVCGMRWEAEG